MKIRALMIIIALEIDEHVSGSFFDIFFLAIPSALHPSAHSWLKNTYSNNFWLIDVIESIELISIKTPLSLSISLARALSQRLPL